MTFHLMYRQAKPTSVSEVGAQTKVLTETGEWTVEYNAENRPIRWTQGDTVITMAFDRMGRRVEMRTQSADSDAPTTPSSNLTSGTPRSPSPPAR